ncbi:MAG: hypothetical protein ABR592_00635 [Nitriliruptorales bacterium]
MPPPLRVAALPHEATLLRVLADPERPLELPPVPAGHVVTASASTSSLVGLLDELELRGYRSVGVHAVLLGRPDLEVIDLLVPAALPRRSPAWWSAAVSCAEHVFRLEFGPVRSALRELLAVHARVTALEWPGNR